MNLPYVDENNTLFGPWVMLESNDSVGKSISGCSAQFDLVTMSAHDKYKVIKGA